MLDTLTALYHRMSGQTHVITEPVPQLLSALGGGECDILTLIGRLGLDDLEETRILLTERLEELVAAGLVTRA